MGLNILVNDEVMSNTIEDWSNVRSPSRAKRSLMRGFTQNIIYKKVPKKEIIKFGDSLMMHSQTKKEMVKQLGQSESNYITENLPF